MSIAQNINPILLNNLSNQNTVGAGQMKVSYHNKALMRSGGLKKNHSEGESWEYKMLGP